VIVTNRTPVRNKGQTATIDLYVSGYGDIEDCKFHVQYNQPKLIDSDKPPKIEYLDSLIPDSDSNPSERGFVSSPPVLFFRPDPEFEGDSMPPLKTEVSNDNKPPIQIELPISTSANPGDYTIPVTFTYEGDGELRQSQTAVDIHVNNFRQKHNRSVAIAGMIVGVAALLRFFGIGLSEVLTAVDWLVRLFSTLCL
jgi:hypothetical protein